MLKTISLHGVTHKELVFKIVETNDSELFAISYNRFFKEVYIKCYGFFRNKEEAEDLTHDIFIRLIVKLKTFKGNSKFSKQLYSFTYNFCVKYEQRIDHKKKEKGTVVKDQIKEEHAFEEIDDMRNSTTKINQQKL